MHDQITSTLSNTFGFTEFRSGQKQVIESLVAGYSAAAVFPTGGGKSICYQLPALLFSGVTIVVSPLIALMKDQIDALQKKGIAARRLDSSLSSQEYFEVNDMIRHGQLKLLYIAPERFNNERFRTMINTIKVSLFAIDEAHCISEWGHNFRPDYLKLAAYAKQCKAERILALTATATPKVLDDICNNLQIKSEHAIRTSFFRENLKLTTCAVSFEERDRKLIEQLKGGSIGATIVYVTLQKTAEYVAELLVAENFNARAYHAGMKDELRHEIQNWFMAADDGIVVATIAFGMGIDKSNIRAVYHYNLAKSLENYAQEIGRAGRDGYPSYCHMFVCPDDMSALENFIFGDTPDRKAINLLLQDLFNRDTYFEISLYTLSKQHDIRLLVLKTLITYLEIQGYLEGGTPFYAEYKYKPLLSSTEILAKFDANRSQFLAAVFQHSVKARTWLTIDPTTTAQQLNCDRERIIKALDYLSDHGMLELSVSKVQLRYHRLKQPEAIHELANRLYQDALKRETAELNRLHQVIEFAALDGCQSQFLSAHFGERLDHDCGHCGWCQSGKTNLIAAQYQAIPTQFDTIFAGIYQDIGKTLTSTRSLTRFLCGLTSPEISKSKLSSHAMFGTLKEIPFNSVLEWLNEYMITMKRAEFE